jgi:hypothetical protein
VFTGTTVADQPGLYGLRVRAEGRTLAGRAFTREQTLSAAAIVGGQPAGDPGLGDLLGWLKQRDECLCRLAQCILEGGVISSRLKRQLAEAGIDLDALAKCLHAWCTCTQAAPPKLAQPPRIGLEATLQRALASAKRLSTTIADQPRAQAVRVRAAPENLAMGRPFDTFTRRFAGPEPAREAGEQAAAAITPPERERPPAHPRRLRPSEQFTRRLSEDPSSDDDNSPKS